MTTNETYAVYAVTPAGYHRERVVEVLHRGTEQECTDFKKVHAFTSPGESRVLHVYPYRAAYKERVQHGVGLTDNDLRGNIHHLVNPIIGMLRIREQDEHTEYYVSRLRAVLALADEYFGKYEEQREFEKWLAERNQGEK